MPVGDRSGGDAGCRGSSRRATPRLVIAANDGHRTPIVRSHWRPVGARRRSACAQRARRQGGLVGYSPSATSAAHWSGSSYQGKWPPGMVTKRAVGILSTLGLPAAGARNRSSSGHTKSSGTVKLAKFGVGEDVLGARRAAHEEPLQQRSKRRWPGPAAAARGGAGRRCRRKPAARRGLRPIAAGPSGPTSRGEGSRAIHVATRPRTGAVSTPMMRSPREPCDRDRGLADDHGPSDTRRLVEREPQ